MKKPKMTPWFRLPAKPARVGLYETRMLGAGDNVLRLWDGYRWRYTHGSICTLFGLPGDKWRGLASNPEKTK